MMKNFRKCSIRKQIIALAMFPVVLVSILSATLEPFAVDENTELNYANKQAGKIQLLVGQVRASRTQAEMDAVLASAHANGIGIERVGVSALAREDDTVLGDSDIRRELKSLLSPELEATLRNELPGSGFHAGLVVRIDRDRALLFSLPALPPQPVFNDELVNMVLEVIVVTPRSIDPLLLVPKGLLGRYVERMFVVNGDTTDPRIVGMPQGYADIVFRAFRGDGLDIVGGDIAAVGAQPRAFKIPDPKVTTTLVVRFRPGGAYPFFRTSMSGLTDRAIPLQELWGDAGSDLLDRLLETSEPHEWLRTVERALCNQLKHQRSLMTTPAAVSGLAADAFGRAADIPTVKAVAEDLNLCERFLFRQFQEAIGISPKVYSRIIRFERAITQASKTETPRWAEISAETGYYDQAHLIADCQKLTGISPTRFLSLWKQGREPDS